MNRPPAPPETLRVLLEATTGAGVLDLLVEQALDTVARAVPAIVEDPESAGTLRGLGAASIRGLTALVTGATHEFEVPPEALQLARVAARRQVTLDDLAEAFQAARQGALTMIGSATQVVHLDLQSSHLMDITRILLWWIDTNFQVILTEHSREHDALLRGAHARRLDGVKRILDGRETDTDRAAGLIDHPLRLTHTALLLWDEAPEESSEGGSVRDVARRLTAAAGGRALVLEVGSHEIWAWLSSGTPLAPTALADVELPDRIRVTLGGASPGLSGFRGSHLQAQALRRLAPALREAPQILVHDDYEIDIFLAGDPHLLSVLVHRELGPLAADTPECERLRRTLRVHYQENLVVARGARTLGVHENTLRYRLQGIADLLGHPLDQRRLQIELALRALHHLSLPELADQR